MVSSKISNLSDEEKLERSDIIDSLREHKSQRAAAKSLGMDKSTFGRRIKKYGIDWKAETKYKTSQNNGSSVPPPKDPPPEKTKPPSRSSEEATLLTIELIKQKVIENINNGTDAEQRAWTKLGLDALDKEIKILTAHKDDNKEKADITTLLKEAMEYSAKLRQARNNYLDRNHK